MSHDYGYDFIRLGRNLERADMTSRIIDVRSANLIPDLAENLRAFENIQWMSVLKSLTAYQMYRRHARVAVRRPDVLRFLLQDRIFPRAFYHCVGEVEGCLRDLPRSDAPLRLVTQLQRTISEAKPDTLSQEALHGFIDDLQLSLGELHDEIHRTYFAITTPAPSAKADEASAA
jgi:uncharacterized alpha-E superfamily protein